MSQREPDIEALVIALREDLPDAHERERLRGRLVAAGLGVAAGVAVSGTAASVAASASMAAAASAPTGLLAKLGLLSVPAKIGAATVVIAVSAVVPLAPFALNTRQHDVGTQSAPSAPARPQVARSAAQVRPQAQALPQAQVQALPQALPPIAHVRDATLTEQPDALIPVPMEAAQPRTPAAPVVARKVLAPIVERSAPTPPLAEPVLAAPAPDAAQRSSLRDETELLQRALRGLHEGKLRAAWAALAAHARNHPSGVLAPERERALQRLRALERSSTASHQVIPNERGSSHE